VETWRISVPPSGYFARTTSIMLAGTNSEPSSGSMQRTAGPFAPVNTTCDRTS
jgi:hypothetical protein